MRVRCTFFFAFGTRTNVLCEEPPGIGVQRTGRGEINVWVHAEADHPSGALKVITEAATTSNLEASHEDSRRVHPREHNGAREVLASHTQSREGRPAYEQCF